MKRIHWTAGVLAISLLITACHSGTNATEKNWISRSGSSMEDITSSGGASKEAGEKDFADNSEGENGPKDSADKSDGGNGPQEAAGEGPREPGPQEAAGEGETIRILENLGTDSRLFENTFCKAGDINACLTIYPVSGTDDMDNDPFLSDNLRMIFSIRKSESESKEIISVYEELKTEHGKSDYPLSVELRTSRGGVSETVSGSIHITFPKADASPFRITVSGNDLLAGDYYEEELIGWLGTDLFSRYLTRRELCIYPTEDLWLLRNTIYAAHGRTFQSESLIKYFKEQPWYRGTTAPEAFPDFVLSDIEKKNIALIRELEQRDADSIRKDQAYALENLDYAPYLPYLDLYNETGLEADLTKAENKGLYFCIPGVISLPLTITRSQWLTVKNGGKAEVCVNELTGETNILEWFEGVGYILHDEKAPPDSYQYTPEVSARYNYETGLYELWMLSHDTIMKPVYEGDIYILNGAVFGGDVSLEGASRDQQVIYPVDGSQGIGEQYETLYGNSLRHNGRGYFTAVYSLGD